MELNTHEWKYRVSDPSIGRFWQIDPLAEDYTYNSTYAFQENKMGLGIELEGLELKRLNDGANELGQGVNRAFTEVTNVKREMDIQGANGEQKAEEAKNKRSSQYSKAEKEVKHGAKETVKGGAKMAGDALENTGDAITMFGVLTAQPEIIAAGKTISGVGTGINAAVDISDGKYEAAIVNSIVSLAFGEVGEQGVKATRKGAGEKAIAAGENKVSEAVIKGGAMSFSEAVKLFINIKFGW